MTVRVTATGVSWTPQATQWLMTLITGSDGIAPRETVWWTQLNVYFLRRFMPLVKSDPLPGFPYR